MTLYDRLHSALTAQILTAVDATFLSALEDPDFGFGDMSPCTMLTHLKTEYGTMTPEELERNQTALSDPWNLDEPIKDLWVTIANIQHLAALGNVPIPDVTVITLTLAMIESTGLLATTTEKFCLRPLADRTLALFKAEFKLGNQERVCKLTAGNAGFHGAHQAIAVTPLPATVAAAVIPTLLHQLRRSTSLLRVAICIIAGCMASASTAITPPPPASTKPRVTKMIPPPSR